MGDGRYEERARGMQLGGTTSREHCLIYGGRAMVWEFSTAMVCVVSFLDSSFCYIRHTIMVIHVQSPRYRISTHLLNALLCITRGCSGCCCAVL